MNQIGTLMEITIIVPAFNEEHKIKKTLRALVRIQEKSIYLHSIQIIVVNNESTDNTRQIIKEFEPKVILIDESRPGTSFARQKALEYATGEIIGCIDADCIPKKQWIYHAVNHLRKPNVVSVAGLCEFDAEYRFSWVPNLLQKLFFPLLHFVFSRIFKRGGMMMAGNVFFKKSTLLAVGGFPIETKFWGDDAMLAKKINQLPGVMVYDTNIAVITSSRRYAHTGIRKTLWNYTKNWILVFFGKTPDQKIEVIR